MSTLHSEHTAQRAQAGTLPKNIWPQDLATQRGAIAFLLLLCAFDCTAVREHILEYVLQKCVKMLRRTLPKSEKWLKNGVPGAPRVPEVPKTLNNSGLCLDFVWIWPLWASFLDTFSAFSFLRASGRLNKGVRERVPK